MRAEGRRLQHTTDGLAGRLVGVGLDGASSAVQSTADVLGGLLGGGLGGVRLNLLLSLGGEILAAEIRHVDCLWVGWCLEEWL